MIDCFIYYICWCWVVDQRLLFPIYFKYIWLWLSNLPVLCLDWIVDGIWMKTFVSSHVSLQSLCRRLDCQRFSLLGHFFVCFSWIWLICRTSLSSSQGLERGLLVLQLRRWILMICHLSLRCCGSQFPWPVLPVCFLKCLALVQEAVEEHRGRRTVKIKSN